MKTAVQHPANQSTCQPPAGQNRKLLDRMRDAIRVRHYSRRTEQAYWIRRFIFFHGVRHPAKMGKDEVNQFLTHLTVKENVSVRATGMRTCVSIAVAALIPLCVIDQRVSSLALQERQSARALVEEFRASSVFWRQFDIGKKIVGLKSTEVFSWLEAWLKHEDRHIRGNVGFVFAALGDQRGLEVIGAILNDQSRWSLKGQIRADRYYAVHLLDELSHGRGDPKAYKDVLRLLKKHFPKEFEDLKDRLPADVQ